MNLDISVTIRNYVSTDTYKVNIYRQGSAIPVMSKDVAVGVGGTVVFQGLPDGYSYEAEVIHNCPNGTQGKKKIAVTPSGEKVCNCPAGYTANTDRTRCVKTSTMAPVAVANYNVGPGPDELNYGINGMRVYAPGFSVDGRGAFQYESGGNHAYWASLGTTTNGRLNLAGVWNSASSTDPIGTWIGFSVTLNVAESKVYWVAIGGDDYTRIKVNGKVIVDQKQNTVDLINWNFQYWHCYPVLLNAGVNIIEMEGYNDMSLGCFAAEIYDCTLDVLKAVTPATEATLNRIFSTADQLAFANYKCEEGWALDASVAGSPVCKKIEYASCS